MDREKLMQQLLEAAQAGNGQTLYGGLLQNLQPESAGDALLGAGLPQSAGADSSLGEGAFDEADVIGEDEVRKANDLLQKYKAGKAALDKRIIENELWFRMGHWKNYKNKMMEGKPTPSSGWLFNSIANKHADAMDNYPEPNVLPRAADDEETAKVLSKILPTVLEQCDYETAYSDTWWRKLKTGTGVKPAARYSCLFP